MDAGETAAMVRALKLARHGPVGINPRVGAVVLDHAGHVVGEGWHDGAGTAHAEVVALDAAAGRARGGTAVVTLEPCSHVGRTGPCSEALIAAGIRRVVYARPDRTSPAAGGARALRAAGVLAVRIDDEGARRDADDLVERWQRATDLGRPFVTWKFATTLDGRSAAADASSRWITSPAARADVHELRAESDVVLVGTGTALIDDPALTVRTPDGHPVDRAPLRAVMGLRPLPPDARLRGGPEPALLLRTHDPQEALDLLWDHGRRDVWLEGGPTLSAAFWRAGLVDRVVAYVAPALLGAGPSAVGPLGITSMRDIARLDLIDVRRVGSDIRIVARPQAADIPPSSPQPNREPNHQPRPVTVHESNHEPGHQRGHEPDQPAGHPPREDPSHVPNQEESAACSPASSRSLARSSLSSGAPTPHSFA